MRDLETLRTALERDGIATRQEEPVAGARRFYADDPVGNRLEFVERLERGAPPPGTA